MSSLLDRAGAGPTAPSVRGFWPTPAQQAEAGRVEFEASLGKARFQSQQKASNISIDSISLGSTSVLKTLTKTVVHKLRLP